MTKANEELLKRIRQLKAAHPAWGYRRVWSYLKYRDKLAVNHKRIYRLMNLDGLLVRKRAKTIAKRSCRSKPRTQHPNRVWGTDMTKILIPSEGWAYLHIALDWGSKKLVAHNLRHSSKTEDWLDCLHDGLNQQFPNGVKENEEPLMLVSDNGCQPTSNRYKDECVSLGIQQIFTSFNNPKGNADTERVIRTIKEDLIWPREWSSFKELETALAIWMKDYNEDFPHMTLNYMTPYEYEKNFNPYYVA